MSEYTPYANPYDNPYEVDPSQLEAENADHTSPADSAPMTEMEQVQMRSFFDRGFMAYSFSSANTLFDKKMFSDPRTLAGDQIVLPVSSLELLTRFRATFPYQFQIQNASRTHGLYCSVLEFTSSEHSNK